MNKFTAGIAIVAAALALAGCSNETEPSATGMMPQPSGEAPSDSAKVGSVADYKSVAQPFVADIEDSIDKFEEYHCFNLPDADEEALCSATVLSAGMRARTAAISFRGSMKPGVPAYLGEVPTELETVVRKTLSAADKADSAATHWSEADCPGSSECRRLGIDVSMAFDDLYDQLTTWRNY